MTNNIFKKMFSVMALEVSHFLERIINIDVPVTRSIYKRMKKKSEVRFKPLKNLMFARSPDPVLKEIGTEKVRQIKRVSLSVEIYRHRNPRVSHFQAFPRRSLPTHVPQWYSVFTVSTYVDCDETNQSMDDDKSIHIRSA